MVFRCHHTTTPAPRLRIYAECMPLICIPDLLLVCPLPSLVSDGTSLSWNQDFLQSTLHLQDRILFDHPCATSCTMHHPSRFRYRCTNTCQTLILQELLQRLELLLHSLIVFRQSLQNLPE